MPALLMMIIGVLAASVSVLAAGPRSPGGAAAEPAWRGLVLVLSPPGEEDELTRDALVRISGELGAALFQVVSRQIDPGVELMAQVETAGNDLAPVAAFAIVRDPGQGAGGIAVWVSNRLTRMTTVQHVRLRSGDVDRAATQLAVETVELVRATMVGLRPELPADAAGPPPAGAARDGGGATAWRFGLAVGVGLFHDFGSVPSSWAPALGLSYGRPDRLELRLGAVGLGAGTEVTLADGTGARLQRQLLSVGGLRRFRADRRVQLMLSAAGGFHHLSADGTGAPAARQHSLSRFSALLSAGVGGALALGPHLALTAEAEALFLWPTWTIQVGTVDAARLHRPALFAHGGLLATF
ncbi:MAG TPA: hypothetical protein VFH68_00955 [Polyangia bacterium]|nr:hypothetical protein [Polyangia bacterium]